MESGHGLSKQACGYRVRQWCIGEPGIGFPPEGTFARFFSDFPGIKRGEEETFQLSGERGKAQIQIIMFSDEMITMQILFFFYFFAYLWLPGDLAYLNNGFQTFFSNHLIVQYFHLCILFSNTHYSPL